ncbi:MAG TPA: S41 family peptidase [Acidobacteriaceae bacterium]|jgi:Tol biopolymer transport system component|nr:S41 family peptidase [Acidobacteriaceae bacterium]
MKTILRWPAALTVLSLAAVAIAQPPAHPAPKPSLAEPALSPDGHEIAFASGGDIWTVPAAGGEAHLLISDPATESRPVYSPDGAQLAFISTRTGGGDIYLFTFASGDLRRLTYSDQPDQLDGWSRDGKWIYFSSSADDVGRLPDVFRVSSAGGTPLEVSRERYLSEFESAPSPDGQTVALCAKGISFSQWWRNGHAHIDETEVWLKPIADEQKARVIIPADSKHAWPMWSPDGKTLYFMSDYSGAENLWSLAVSSGEPKQITHFEHGRVLYPSIGYDGKSIVFERNLTIWKLDLAGGHAAEVPITLRGAASSPHEQLRHEDHFDDLALSPDGKKVAVVAHGDIFAAPAKDGGEGFRVTHTPEREEDVRWSPDSNRIVYVSERGGHHNLYEYDFTTNKERALTTGEAESENPRYSPDGKFIAFTRDDRELHLLTLSDKSDTATDKVLAHDTLERPELEWSPNSQWIVYTAEGVDGFRNLKVVPAAGGDPQPVSFLANGETAFNIAWSPDGKFLLFETAQRSENFDLARVDLTPHVPKYREDELSDLFKAPGAPSKESQPKPGEPAPAEPEKKSDAVAETARPSESGASARPKKFEPINIAFDGIRDRLTFVPVGLSVLNPVISPDGKMVVFLADVANHSNLYSYSLEENPKEPPVPRQLTTTASRKGSYWFTPDSKELVYLDNGQPRRLTLESHDAKPIPVTATFAVDFDQDKQVAFDEAWETLNRFFFDPDFNGHNWTALRAEFEPFIEGARTGDEMRRDINLMIGELNSSHSGINHAQPPAVHTGRLGLRFVRADYESGKGLVIREVVPLGPAAIEGSIQPGETLVAVNGQTLDAHTNLNELLEDQAGRRVVLRIAGKDGKQRDAAVQPIDGAEESGLLYRAWVDQNRALVDKLSHGHLGYVHLADMSDGSLKQLYIDLDAQNQAKDGVVVDVRNNNGGYINGYALDVFTRKNYLLMTTRGMPTEPSRQELGQRALGKPTILLTNESSLSDSEDFTQGYRDLHLGKVVGTPTAGWIIYTGGRELIDGSVVRVPGTRIQTTDHENMEMHPRPVDVEVTRQPGETIDGTDSQIERAVTELMSQLGDKK